MDDIVIKLTILQRFKMNPVLTTDGESYQMVTNIASRCCLEGAGVGVGALDQW